MLERGERERGEGDRCYWNKSRFGESRFPPSTGLGGTSFTVWTVQLREEEEEDCCSRGIRFKSRRNRGRDRDRWSERVKRRNRSFSRFESRVSWSIDRYEIIRGELLFLFNRIGYALESDRIGSRGRVIPLVRCPDPISFPFILFIFDSVVSFTTGHHLVLVPVVNIVARWPQIRSISFRSLRTFFRPEK